jgi:hypothetical protein
MHYYWSYHSRLSAQHPFHKHCLQFLLSGSTYVTGYRTVTLWTGREHGRPYRTS